MATNFEKILAGLLIVSIVVSASSLFVLSGLLDLPNKITALDNKLSEVQSGLAAKELFPGETDLYVKAQTEGSLIVFTTWDAQDILSLLAGFSQRYPGVSTTYWAATGSAIQARVLQDLQAGQQTVDILQGGFVTSLVSKNATTPYTNSQLDKLILNRTDMTAVQDLVPVIGYNTNLMNASDLPKSWEDLTNPKYQGLVCAGDPSKAGTHTTTIFATLKQYWNNDTRYTNFVQGIKALQPALYDSSSTMMRLVVSGEYAIGFGLMAHDVLREMDKGSPISYVQIGPVIVTGSWGAMYLNAPHPNAAKLYTEWVESTEGQLIVAGQFRTPNRIGVPSRVSVEALFPGTSPVIGPPSDFITASDAYITQYILPVWNA